MYNLEIQENTEECPNVNLSIIGCHCHSNITQPPHTTSSQRKGMTLLTSNWLNSNCYVVYLVRLDQFSFSQNLLTREYVYGIGHSWPCADIYCIHILCRAILNTTTRHKFELAITNRESLKKYEQTYYLLQPLKLKYKQNIYFHSIPHPFYLCKCYHPHPISCCTSNYSNLSIKIQL